METQIILGCLTKNQLYRSAGGIAAKKEHDKINPLETTTLISKWISDVNLGSNIRTICWLDVSNILNSY
jgi:hypothetical protein